MFTVRGSTRINRPIDDVFRYLADFEHDREWRSEVVSVWKLCNDRYEESVHFPGFSVTSEFEVKLSEPPRLLIAEGVSEDIVATQRYELTAESPDVTRLDVATGIDNRGPLAIGDFIAQRLLRARARQNLSRLKRVLEGNGRC
ncbi:MAG TPA: SRPBCC family protein [Coriobacteriia bacterium]|jgi:carbon monoxide dehydrogenase subunit G